VKFVAMSIHLDYISMIGCLNTESGMASAPSFSTTKCSEKSSVHFCRLCHYMSSIDNVNATLLFGHIFSSYSIFSGIYYISTLVSNMVGAKSS
jgi:hypothetical protein